MKIEDRLFVGFVAIVTCVPALEWIAARPEDRDGVVADKFYSRRGREQYILIVRFPDGSRSVDAEPDPWTRLRVGSPVHVRQWRGPVLGLPFGDEVSPVTPSLGARR